MSARSSGLAACLLLLFTIAAPAQTPPKPFKLNEDPSLIGRREINKRQFNFYSLRKEAELGRQLAAEIDRQVEFVTDPLVTVFINRLGQNLVEYSDAKVAFTIKVIDTEEVNALALPGGFLYVNRGLLETVETEAELAGIMAHEIAHVAARHGVEQLSKVELVNIGTIALSVIGGWEGIVIRQMVSLFLPLGLLKFTRGREKEADVLGAQYLWAAGYDPQGMVTFFERLEEEESGLYTRAYNTHPMMSDRVKNLRRLIDRFPPREEYLLNSSEFLNVQSRAILLGESRRAGLMIPNPTGAARSTSLSHAAYAARPLKRRTERSPAESSSVASAKKGRAGCFD